MSLRTAGRRVRAGFVALLVWSGLFGPATLFGASAALAQEQALPAPPPLTDRLQLFRLTADAPGPEAPPGSVRFDAIVDYQLATSPRAFLLFFFFEDGSRQATQSSSQGFPVTIGTNRVQISAVYLPKTQAESLSVLIGLFRPDEKMLAWTSTTPMSLSPLPGRAAFTNAMAARLAGDHQAAVESLSHAIQLAPQNPTYYYWRADSRVNLGLYDAAIFDYSLALELQPDDRASLAGRGIALLWKEEWEPAIADLSRVIQETQVPDPPATWAYRGRGIARAALGQAAGAIEDYRTYLSLVPTASDRAVVDGWIADLTALGAP
jgi:tetratricopeptide (TPR) repeat protein